MKESVNEFKQGMMYMLISYGKGDGNHKERLEKVPHYGVR
jgi:hypothetical protein